MSSVSVRRSTCKAPGVFGADCVDLVSLGFQPEPPDRGTEGRLWSPFPRPSPAPPAHGSYAAPGFTPPPPGRVQGGPLPPGGGRAELYGAGPSPGQHWAATWSWYPGASVCRGATRGSAVWAFPKVSHPSRRHPSAQSSALFYSEPFASTSAVRQWKTNNHM